VPELGKLVIDSAAGEWLKSEGDQVKAGEPLVELDKINCEVEAEEAGVLESI
jgi:pyruvate/2-oxoglutarate dehydrogenase complex dihydrolipoamide acyltransferase (E2) component